MISEARLGFVPMPGQTVKLDGRSSPQFKDHPLTLLITAETEPSTVDAAQGRTALRATWVLVTGWELGRRGQRVIVRNRVPVRVSGIELIEHHVRRLPH